MKLKLLFILLVFSAGLACKPPAQTNLADVEEQVAKSNDVCFFLPTGDAAAGREAFLALGCNSCHAVDAPGFPFPVASPQVPVRLGPNQAKLTRAELVESIVAPSHQIPAGMENVSIGQLSRMGDYSHCMTVRQLVDLVAFIQTLDKQNEST